MSRLSRLGTLLRVAARAGNAQASSTAYALPSVPNQALPASASFVKEWIRPFHYSVPKQAAPPADLLGDDSEQATGLERVEYDAHTKGIHAPWEEDWLDAPWGTEDNPVEVPSYFAERIVGVPDPEDDSIIWWGTINEGDAPKQIIEGGEFFVLKKLASEGSAHH